MSFLKISSISTTNSTDMFTLGVSTARGNAEKIGQFGSGSLMATLLWIRLYGVSPIFMINGRRVEFICKPERTTTGGTFRRIYMLEDGESTPMSVALEYGEVDWRSHDMSLREYISNAIDQGTDITESMELAQEIVGRPDSVEVYIPINPDVTKYWHNIDKYFLHFNNKQTISIIDKSEMSHCRVYRRGVFIRELGCMSLFDYNLDFDINESRNGSSDSMEREIYRVCGGYNPKAQPTDEHREKILRYAIANNSGNHPTIETNTASRYSIHPKLWKETFEKVAGGKKFSIINGDNNICVDSSWYNDIKEICPHLDGLFDLSPAKRSNNLIPVKPDAKTVKRVECLWEKLKALGMTNDKQMPKVELFKTKNGQQPYALGLYSGGTISIWADQVASNQTILEELLHHASDCEDHSSAFQEFIIRTLTEAMEHI